MGTVLNKLLTAYRKEQVEKYAQVKSRQTKRKPDSEPRTAGAAGDAANGDVAAAQASAPKSPKSPGSGIKRMKLVLSRSSGEKVGAASMRPPAGQGSSASSAASPAGSEYDL